MTNVPSQRMPATPKPLTSGLHGSSASLRLFMAPTASGRKHKVAETAGTSSRNLLTYILSGSKGLSEAVDHLPCFLFHP